MSGFKISLLIFFMPPDGFRAIKRDRKNFRWSWPLLIIAATLLVRVFNLVFTGYLLGGRELVYVNFLQEILSVLMPMMLWVAGCFLVTIILSGECLLREIWAATAYAMLPAILLTVPLTLLSRVLSVESTGLYNVLWGIVFIWCGILVLISIYVMNSYTLGKTLGVACISLFACAFLVTVGALLYVLGIRVVDFIAEVINEYRILFQG